VNKYLHTLASVGFLFALNYDARNHELKMVNAFRGHDLYTKLVLIFIIDTGRWT